MERENIFMERRRNCHNGHAIATSEVSSICAPTKRRRAYLLLFAFDVFQCRPKADCFAPLRLLLWRLALIFNKFHRLIPLGDLRAYFPSVLKKYTHVRTCNCAGTKSSNVSINTKTSNQLRKGKSKTCMLSAPAMFHGLLCGKEQKSLVLVAISARLLYVCNPRCTFPCGQCT